MNKKTVWILVVGILIRLLLAFSTFHSDIQPFYFAGEVISKGNILNFYDYLSELPKDSPILSIYPTYLFNYPPMVYFFLGPISYLLSLPFSQELMHYFIFDPSSLMGNLELNFLLLTLKLPYLIFDIGIAVFLYRLFDDSKQRNLALSFWILNPFNLYSTYMMGQFDIIPTFLTVLALYLAVKRKKVLLSAFFLGIGASFKIFPFLFLIPLALLETKWWRRIVTVGVGILVYVASILPFINSQGFRVTAFVAGQTTKSFFAAIPISRGESIILFLFSVLFFYLIFYFKKVGFNDLWKKFFIIILLFFVFTHYHPQWFLWLVPFLIIDLVRSDLKHWPLAALSLVSWLGLVIPFDPRLSVWLFAPIFPKLYGAMGIGERLGMPVDSDIYKSILQTLFVSAAAYYLYFHFPRESKA